MSTTTTGIDRPNRFAGTCCYCGRSVAAFDGEYQYGDVACAYHAGTEGHARWVADERDRDDLHRLRIKQFATLRQLLGLAVTSHQYELATDPTTQRIEAERRAAVAECHRVAEANDGTVCERCGGAGGSKSWPGFTCYGCDGLGWVPVA